MPIVKFNSVEEYLEELRKEYSEETDIVRVTRETRISSNMAISHLTVISTARSTSHPEDIIRLERYCGQLCGHGTIDDKTYEIADNATKALQAACEELALEVRAGVLEPA